MTVHFDLHCHSRFSSDGIAEPEELIEQARRIGLHGFAITDHNTSECVDYFEKHGYIDPSGEPVDGLLIIPGQEITTRAGHLLALGVNLPDIKGIDPAEAVARIHAEGGLAIPPHPFDNFRAGIRESVLDSLHIDALETFNAACTFRRCNRQAAAYASKRGLPMTASSDAHHAGALGTAYTMLEVESLNRANVLAAIKQPSQRRERYLSASAAMKKTFGNILRLKRRKQPQKSLPTG